MIEPEIAAERPHPTHDEIARRAYSYWEQRGRPEGSPEVDWFRAEQELGERRVHVNYRPETLTISDTHID
jgi:hypothetical protein